MAKPKDWRYKHVGWSLPRHTIDSIHRYAKHHKMGVSRAAELLLTFGINAVSPDEVYPPEVAEVVNRANERAERETVEMGKAAYEDEEETNG